MKRLTFLLLFTFCSVNFYSQCTENAFSFGNNTSNPTYNVSGDISVTLNADNTITLDIGSNFTTEDGPDVRVYLVKSNGMSDAMIRSTKIAQLENIPLGMVACTDCVPEIPAAGAKSFTVDIPENTDITEFDKVFFYCLAFNAFWDVGSFNAFTNQSCEVLSTSENEFVNVAIYPNPATSIIELNNIDVLHAEIHIFDVHGKSVFTQVNQNNSVIDVSNFTSGTYFLRIYQNQQVLSKKLIVQ